MLSFFQYLAISLVIIITSSTLIKIFISKFVWEYKALTTKEIALNRAL